MQNRRVRLRRAAAVSLPRIREVAKQIAVVAKPVKIILYGSHARGTATADSDVDLLIITKQRPHTDTSLSIRRRISYDFALDLVIVDVNNLAKRVEQGDNFLREAVTSGKVLYESAQMP